MSETMRSPEYSYGEGVSGKVLRERDRAANLASTETLLVQPLGRETARAVQSFVIRRMLRETPVLSAFLRLAKRVRGSQT